MARKEKNAALPTMGLVSVALVCIFIAAAGCGYLWNKSQIHTLGVQIRGYEARLDDAKRRHQSLDLTYAKMLSAADLDDRVKRMRLEIGPPQPDQIIRLQEPPLTTDEKLIAHRSKLAGEEGRD